MFGWIHSLLLGTGSRLATGAPRPSRPPPPQSPLLELLENRAHLCVGVPSSGAPLGYGATSEPLEAAFAARKIVRDDGKRAVEIPDAGLQTAIRKILRKPAGPLTASDLAGVTALYIQGAGAPVVGSLEGLQHAVNLRFLYVDRGRIVDLKPLAGLRQLEGIGLRNHRVRDLQPLEDLPRLRRLVLSGNFVADASPLDGSRTLREVNLRGNRLTAVRFGDLPSLRFLDLSANAITRATVDGTPALTELDLSSNNISDLRLVRGLQRAARLRLLLLARNRIDDVGPLHSLGGGTAGRGPLTLDLSKNELSSIRPLARVRRLHTLSVDSNKLTDLRGVGVLTSLRVLIASRNPLRDIRPVRFLSRLVTLNLAETGTTRIGALRHLRALRDVELQRNSIEDISALTHLRSDAALDVSRNLLDLTPGSEDGAVIATLRARGVVVKAAGNRPPAEG